jgi:hypothetical protein
VQGFLKLQERLAMKAQHLARLDQVRPEGVQHFSFGSRQHAFHR